MTPGPKLIVLALTVALGAGCSFFMSTEEEGDGGSGGDGGADAEPERVCVVPETSCDDGYHAEYNLCIVDSEEIAVAGGSFDMGAPSGDELPLHSVTVSDFVIDRTEVTNRRFAACVEAGCCDAPTYDGSYTGREPYFGNEAFDNFPVVFVTWERARDYCEGLGKRLPTEAEWELAARGTDGRPFPWGSEQPTTGLANYGGARDGDTHEVGRHSDGASAFGLEDMAGNVWEWVADWYSYSYYNESPGTDPQGPDGGVTRVARGGSFGSASTELYAFDRTSFHPIESFANLGFRCAR